MHYIKLSMASIQSSWLILPVDIVWAQALVGNVARASVSTLYIRNLKTCITLET